MSPNSNPTKPPPQRPKKKLIVILVLMIMSTLVLENLHEALRYNEAVCVSHWLPNYKSECEVVPGYHELNPGIKNFKPDCITLEWFVFQLSLVLVICMFIAVGMILAFRFHKMIAYLLGLYLLAWLVEVADLFLDFNQMESTEMVIIMGLLSGFIIFTIKDRRDQF